MKKALKFIFPSLFIRHNLLTVGPFIKKTLAPTTIMFHYTSLFLDGGKEAWVAMFVDDITYMACGDTCV